MGGCPTAQTIKTVVITGRPNAPFISLSINNDTIYSNTSFGTRWFRDGAYLPFFDNSRYIANPSNGNYRCILVDVLNCESDSSNLLSFWSSGVQNFARNNLKVVPNPNVGNFELKLEHMGDQILDIVVINSIGKRCDVMVERSADLPSKYFIRFKNPESGVYYLCVFFRDRTLDFSKIIVF